MSAAIALARPRVGQTGENPAVGCVLVRAAHQVAAAATAEGGRPHAEEQALEAAGPLAEGATAYVTLEPCGARSAGTLSCAERLVRAGVVRVVIATTDPSPYASSRGIQRLREAGIAVEVGLLQAQAAELCAEYQAQLSAAPAIGG